MIDRIKSSVLIGLAFACIYSLYVCGLYLLEGSRPFDRLHTTLGIVVLMYFSGGIAAGVTVGLLQPLARSRAGAIFVGIIAAFFVFLGIGVGMDGLPSRWGGDSWGSVVLCAVLFGAFGGNMFWKDPLI
jgi:hypothetical protein